MTIVRTGKELQQQRRNPPDPATREALRRLADGRRRRSWPTLFYLAPPAISESWCPQEAALREAGFTPLCWVVFRRWYSGAGGQLGTEVWVEPSGEIVAEVGAPTTEWREQPLAGATFLSTWFSDGHRLVLRPPVGTEPRPNTTELDATGDLAADLTCFRDGLERLRAEGRTPLKFQSLADVQALQDLFLRQTAARDPVGLAILAGAVVAAAIFASYAGAAQLLTLPWLIIPATVLWRISGVVRPKRAPRELPP